MSDTSFANGSDERPWKDVAQSCCLLGSNGAGSSLKPRVMSDRGSLGGAVFGGRLVWIS